MASLKIRNVTKTFEGGNIIASDNVSLDLKDGEFFVLLGPSGCGKSTLLRIVSGLEEQDSGEIYIEDKNMRDKEPASRPIAMMFQKTTLYPNMNVYDNISFPLKIRGADENEIDERVEELLELEQISDKKYSNVKTLSGGEAQRVMLARVLIQDPEIFLLDEPFANLDYQLRLHMRKEILRIHRKTGVTVLFVTHNQNEAMRLGDRLAIMDGGRIKQVGTPKEIFVEPKNRFVAQFIGEPQMNFIPGKIKEDGDLFVELDSKTYGPIKKDTIVEKPSSPRIELGVRPEEVKVEKGVSTGENRFTSEIELIESTGPNTYVYLDAAGTLIQADVSSSEEWKEGDEVTYWFEKENVKIFDENGNRVK